MRSSSFRKRRARASGQCLKRTVLHGSPRRDRAIVQPQTIMVAAGSPIASPNVLATPLDQAGALMWRFQPAKLDGLRGFSSESAGRRGALLFTPSLPALQVSQPLLRLGRELTLNLQPGNDRFRAFAGSRQYWIFVLLPIACLELFLLGRCPRSRRGGARGEPAVSHSVTFCRTKMTSAFPRTTQRGRPHRMTQALGNSSLSLQ